MTKEKCIFGMERSGDLTNYLTKGPNLAPYWGPLWDTVGFLLLYNEKDRDTVKTWPETFNLGLSAREREAYPQRGTLSQKWPGLSGLRTTSFFFFLNIMWVCKVLERVWGICLPLSFPLCSLPLGWLLFLHTYSLPDQKHELHSSRKKLYLKEVWLRPSSANSPLCNLVFLSHITGSLLTEIHARDSISPSHIPFLSGQGYKRKKEHVLF